MMPSVCGNIPGMLNLPLYSQAYMVMLRFLLTGGSASLWKTITSRNVSAVLSRVWAGRSSQAATWCRHSFATNLTHAGVPYNYISESMGHSVDTNITNRYIDAFPLAQQMEFNSRLLKLNDDADIMEELKGLTPEQLKALIAMVKK